MIVLVRVGAAPLKVWTQRDMMTGTYLPGWYCFPNVPYCREEVDIAYPGSGVNQWLEDYWLIESHTVTAMAIPEPLSMEGPEVVAPGDSATFTANPSSSDLRLRDRNGQPSRFFWLWYANDTIPASPPASSPTIVCLGQLQATCQFEPKVSGRLRVQTFVEGALVNVDRVVRVQQQRLELSCPSSVVRASTVQCTVSAVPTGTIDSVRWAFVDTAGHTIRDDSTGLVSWTGPIVVGGRVSVSAKLNGQRVSQDTTVKVTPRGWTSPVPSRRTGFHGCVVVTTTCVLRYPPIRYSDMGTTVKQPRSFSLLGRAATIDTGPNAGWSYLSGSDSPIQFREQVILLNEVLNLGNGDPVTAQFWAGQPQCVPRLVVQDVTAHENHHADLYDRNRGTLDAELEKTMAFVPAPQWQAMLNTNGPEATRAANRLNELAGGLHRPSDGFPALSCILNLLP
jgi:hypothetical protein